MADKPVPFRVHFEDGSHWNINASDAQAARKLAKPVADQRRTTVRKIKVVRENAGG